MKKILVPTDLSPIADMGLKLAAEIAKKTNASISLVHFHKHPMTQSFSAMGEINAKVDEETSLYTVQLLRATKVKLEERAREYEQQGVSVSFSIEDDGLKQGIDEYVSRQGVDLIVMGTSGEESGEEVFIGNHTEQVINASSCPVISVRDGFRAQDFKTIVVAVNTMDQDQLAMALSSLRELAVSFDAHVHLVHACNPASDYSSKELTDFFSKAGEDAEIPSYSVTILESDDHAQGIIDFARNSKAGMVAVVKTAKDGIFRVFSNHFSNRLVKEVGRPVFTFNMQSIEV